MINKRRVYWDFLFFSLLSSFFFLKLTGHQSFIALLTNTNNNKVNNILYVYILYIRKHMI